MRINRLLFEINCQNILGENIIWRADEQALYWTDVESKCLYKCLMTPEVIDLLCNDNISESARLQRDEYIAQVMQVFDLPFRLGSFAFTKHNDTIVAGFENGLALYRYNTGEISWLSQAESDLNFTRFNDGRCDPKGRFWIGSMLEKAQTTALSERETASLYRFDGYKDDKQSFTHELVLSGLQISNGLCFSEDALVMYHADSPSHKIYQYDLSEAGDILHKKLFAKFDKHSYPDGACVDRYENVWSALWGRASVVCLNSKGKEILRHPLAVTQPTCVTIGGPNMNWLFVSSARMGLAEEKLASQTRAGNLFVYELDDSIGREEYLVNI